MASTRLSTKHQFAPVSQHNVENNAINAEGATAVTCGRKKKNYSFCIIDGENISRVCKDFYLSTLAISQKMVYKVHEKRIW